LGTCRTNDDDVASIGWDPGAIKRGATIQGGKDPSSAKHLSVAAAQWLAWESLPFFPARWMAGTREEIIFVLPQHPVGYRTAKTMLISGPHLQLDELRAQGWSKWSVALWKSGRDTYLAHARTVSDWEVGGGSRRGKQRSGNDLSSAAGALVV
jgi:hypothetical protein